jgi:hypothetical protein
MPEIHVVDAQGVTHVFPDGSTPEMIAKAMNVKPPDANPSGNAVQRVVDNLTTVTPAQEAATKSIPVIGGALNQAQKFGAGAIQGVTQPFVHPLDTLSGIGQMIAHPIDTGKQMVQSAIENPAQTAGNLVGGAVLGNAAGEVAGPAAELAKKAAAPIAKTVGQAAQDAGTGLVNKTVGTLKNDFKRGANPGRGYLETGNGPALTMRGIAEKSADAAEATGQKLDAAYKAADGSGKLIPVQDVANAIAEPMKEAHEVATGVGAPKGLLEDLKYHASTFRNVIAQGQEQGGFTPSQVWKIKKDLAKATSWSDPTQVGLKSVTQQQVGALSGVLQEAIPEVGPLNQSYMDLLKMSARAEERANTGSRPLTAHIYKALMMGTGAMAGGMEGNPLLGLAAGAAMDSVPGKTAIATGLFRGGRALSGLGERLAPTDSVTVEGVASNGLRNNAQGYKPQNPQLSPPGPFDLRSGENPSIGLPSPARQQFLTPETAGTVPQASNYPQLNEAAARMKVQPTQFNPQPTPTPSSGRPLSVTPSGQVALESKALPAPSAAAPKLSGRALWAKKGSANLAAHGVSASEIEALSNTAKGKQLLVIASGLTPGSAAMKGIVRQIKALEK